MKHQFILVIIILSLLINFKSYSDTSEMTVTKLQCPAVISGKNKLIFKYNDRFPNITNLDGFENKEITSVSDVKLRLILLCNLNDEESVLRNFFYEKGINDVNEMANLLFESYKCQITNDNLFGVSVVADDSVQGSIKSRSELKEYIDEPSKEINTE